MAQEVEAFLDKSPAFLGQLSNAPTLNPVKPPPTDKPDPEEIVEEPPEKIFPPKPMEKPWVSRKERRIDFALRDAINRQLAKLGEEFVVKLEQHRLVAIGRDDLAKKVNWLREWPRVPARTATNG